jgi:hypothetical protein
MTNKKHKKYSVAGCWWLTPIILTTWETEIGRIAVWDQPREIVLKISISKSNQSKNGLELCGSSGRMPALQVWNPGFKTHQIK